MSEEGHRVSNLGIVSRVNPHLNFALFRSLWVKGTLQKEADPLIHACHRLAKETRDHQVARIALIVSGEPEAIEFIHYFPLIIGVVVWDIKNVLEATTDLGVCKALETREVKTINIVIAEALAKLNFRCNFFSVWIILSPSVRL